MILKFAAETAFSLETSLKISLQSDLRVVKQYGWNAAWDTGREETSRAMEIRVIKEWSTERSKVAAGAKTDGWKLEDWKRHSQELLIARTGSTDRPSAWREKVTLQDKFVRSKPMRHVDLDKIIRLSAISESSAESSVMR